MTKKVSPKLSKDGSPKSIKFVNPKAKLNYGFKKHSGEDTRVNGSYQASEKSDSDTIKLLKA